MLRSDASPIALLRAIPLLFPVIFLWAAISGILATLYAAVMLHFLILAAEMTVGRRYSHKSIPLFVQSATAFEDACLLAWTGMHALALVATLYFVASSELNARQVFAIGALFAYSINTFSAAAAHEMLHRDTEPLPSAARFLYAVMLYPHFPTVHLASHHRWAGTDRDCQTPRSQQSIHAYLVQAFLGGIRVARTQKARAFDKGLTLRILLSLIVVATPLCFDMAALSLLLVTQGIFSFVLIETINFIQHYKTTTTEMRREPIGPGHANQDTNFVSRCLLFNLPLHAAHHQRSDLTYTDLARIPGAVTSRTGYWCSFWLVWTPPLWDSLHRNRNFKRTRRFHARSQPR